MSVTMLQPRKRKFTLKIVLEVLLLCVIVSTFIQNSDCAKGEDEKNGLIKDKIRRGERVIKHGDVNIVVLDDFDRKKTTPSLGLLSTTARTFIQEGTTTEFATHIYGTTVGDKYAHIVSTGSKIFYDSARPFKEKIVDPIISIPSLDSLVFPLEENIIVPSKVIHDGISDDYSVLPDREEMSSKISKSLKPNVPSVMERTPLTFPSSPITTNIKKSHNHVSMLKEISIKPAKVKLKNELPTFTVKQDSSEVESKSNQIHNSEFVVDNVVQSNRIDQHDSIGKRIELTTTTYFGFADFVTTAGNTVIIFTPKTKKPNFEGTVTFIPGEATLNTVHNIHSTTAIDATKPTQVAAIIAATITTPIIDTVLNETEEQIEIQKELVETMNAKDIKNDDVRLVTPNPEVETTSEMQGYTTDSVTEISTEDVITTTNLDILVKNNDVPFLINNDSLESSIMDNRFSTPTTELYKTLTYVTTFFLPSGTTSLKSSTVKVPISTASPVTEESAAEVTTEGSSADVEEESTEPNEITTVGISEAETEKSENEIGFITLQPSQSEEEVELIFKTLYTTYTYLTTFFEKSTTHVQSREEVVTNVMTSTLDSAFLQEATDPAVAGLFSGHREGKFLPNSGIGRPTTSYYHTEKIQDNEILSSSINMPEYESRKPTPSLKLHPRLTESSMKLLHPSPIIKSHVHSVSNKIENTLEFTESELTLKMNQSIFQQNESRLPSSSMILQHSPSHAYKTTIRRIRPKVTDLSQTVHGTQNPSLINTTVKTGHPDSIVSEEMSFNSVISAPLTSTKETTEQSPKNMFLSNDSEDDQLSQESNTEETHPNQSLISLQTSYTTYTYFTTIYKGSTSNIISRLETVTNVNTELIKPTPIDTAPVDESTAPVTYYTTYTYWTTFYKDGSTMIKSRQETVSNVVTPTVTQETKAEKVIPSQTTSFTEPVTYYTTFTYFTTSYVANSTVVNSHLETVTNVINATKVNTHLTSESNFIESTNTHHPIFQPVDIISSVAETGASDITTVNLPNTTETYNDSLHSQILSSSINESKTIPIKEVSTTGTVLIDEGFIVDAFGISTTFYMTKVIGTYIEQLYAQLIQSTSSVKVNTDKRTNLFNPLTVILNDKIYQTGVLQVKEGSIRKHSTTTFYTTKIVGSVINNQYSSITETVSSVHVEEPLLPSTTVKYIQSTPVADLSSTIEPTQLVSISPSPSVIESSLNDSSEDEENVKDEKDTNKSNRRKSFTPVIRPFASRSRPTFLPKKKIGEASGAATITRGITPTIVAIPAVKTSEGRVFGSGNRNRFAGGSRKTTIPNTPVSEIPTGNLHSRRFSRPKSSPTFNPTLGSQYSRALSTKSYAASSSTYRRGSNYRSSNTKTFDYLNPSSVGSRFRIRPTVSGRFGYSSSATPKIEENISEIITEQALSSSDEETIETLPPPTVELSRRNNPLLRFRKPTTSPGVPLSSFTKSVTEKKNAVSRRNDAKVTTPKTITSTKSERTRVPNYNNNNRLRLKSPNNILPVKSSSRKPESEDESSTEQINKEEKETDIEEHMTENTEQTFSNAVTEKQVKNSRTLSPVSIKPFLRRGRIKRQAEFGYKYESFRAQKSRYRRPSMQNAFPDYMYYDELEYTTEGISARSVGSRNSYVKSHNTPQLQQVYQQPYQQYQQMYQITTPLQQQTVLKIRPSTTANVRSPFTLREKVATTTSHAPQRSNRRTTVAPLRKYENNAVTKRTASRHRSYTSTTEATSYRNNRKSSRRFNSRSRYKDNDHNANSYIQPNNDGTITVTYKIPTEVTIPVVNGKVTEYKNVVTAKPSIQILAPHQYSTVIGKNGLNTLQLLAENTETMLNGIVEVTRYVIHEFSTSSITFTPTTIRGRKTSFSHVIPSTVYEVKPEVSTIAPQLNANAPLANLLLSQLLLGNLGIQQTSNPLLGINHGSVSPVTEYKTRTTSYVTTITHSTSTIIPVTFRGKEIKTTVVDSSTQVITATEYITESVIVSPTQSVAANNDQLKTLLLPALLQAQLLNQQQSITPSNTQISDENINDNLQSIQDIPTPSKVSKNGLNFDNENLKNEEFDSRDQRKNKKGKPFDSPIKPAETSVVTLYLSGRRPGEFSTVLSTVTLDEEKSATLQKRNVESVDQYDLKPSDVPTLSPSISDMDDDNLVDVIKSGINDIFFSDTTQETQSLESIVGDVSNYLLNQNMNTLNVNVKSATSTKISSNKSNHFLLKTSTESTPFQWNSTFIRGNRRKRVAIAEKGFISQFISVSGKNERSSPFTWKPDVNWSKKLKSGNKTSIIAKKINNGTFKNVSVSAVDNMEVSVNHLRTDNYSLSVDDEGRGRYNLATKVMSNGVEVIVALDKSTLPGSPQLLRVLPTSNIRPITFTPHTVTDHMIMMLPHGLQDIPNPFVTKTYLTTYTYLTTLLKGGTIVTSSEEKVVSNIFTENIDNAVIDVSSADVHITLDSSPILATKVFQTTYNMESTIRDGNSPHIVTNQQTVSNTITVPSDFIHLLQPSEPNFNEISSGPLKENSQEESTIRPTEKLTIDFQSKKSENSIEVKPTQLQASDIIKTYFVTYTYYRTLLENNSVVVTSDIATSSDVVTEKYYLPSKRTKHPVSSMKETVPVPVSNTPVATGTYSYNEKSIHIFATKTYLTTSTFFTTLLQDKGSKPAQTVIRSRTKVIQNVVTETLHPSLLNSDYLALLKSSLRKDSLPITATAPLNDGQRVEITAMNENSSTTPSIDRLSSSIEESQEYNQIMDTDIQEKPMKSGYVEPSKINFFDVSHDKTNGSNYIFTTMILQSSTVLKNGATLFPGSQIIKFIDQSGNVSIIPVSDPVIKHPGSLHNKKPNSTIQMNDLLNFGTLGINGLNALKPVLNAMAGLLQSNVKSNVKNKNEGTVKPIKPYLDNNPIIEFSTNMKTPTRTPIYIPVGSIDDNDEAGSEDIIEQYPDVVQRTNNAPLGKPTVEKPLVSGVGIPISPGQVITANTDVIVGTPAVLGPRPPIKVSQEKSDVPIGMRPPPVAQLQPSYSKEEEDHIVSNPYRFNDIVKIPPKPLSPMFQNNGFQLPGNLKYPLKSYYKHNIDHRIPLPSEIRISQLPLNTPLSQMKEQQQVQRESSSNLQTPTKLQPPPVVIEPSSLNSLLVDVRPSQVAQVIIPHDGQNALIYNDQVAPYNTKGEIFNDPSPYPEENVNPGFVGLKVYGPVNSGYPASTSKIASNTIHLDIPINPYTDNGTITESHHFVTLNFKGKPLSPYNIISSVLKAPSADEPHILKRPNNKYNITSQGHSDMTKPNLLYNWHQSQPLPNLETDLHGQRPHLFPPNRPTNVPFHHFTAESDNDYNYVGLYGENEPNDETHFSESGELTQETKLKPSSNSNSNGSSPSFEQKIKDSSQELVSDFDINYNREIFKKNPVKVKEPANKTETKIIEDKNSTMREHPDNPDIKYTEWTSMEYPPYNEDNETKITDYSRLWSPPGVNFISAPNQEKDNLTIQINSHTRNPQDNIVIGMSPPPRPPSPRPTSQILPRPVSPSQKPHTDHKAPIIRSSIKTGPKSTSPPYPFEKPTPSPVIPTRTRQSINSRPPPNVLYETDPPNFSEELMKLKPLNTTGKIEPVKKWPTAPKPVQPVLGSIIKVQDPLLKDEDKGTSTSSVRNDTDRAQSDTKIIIVEKPDRIVPEKTTELISKWNEIGVISSSENDFEEEEQKNTPTLESDRTKTNTVPNTIFGNLYTRPPPANIVIIPTHSTTQHYTAISMIVNQEKLSERDSNESFNLNTKSNNQIAPIQSSHVGQFKEKETKTDQKNLTPLNSSTSANYITHTKTLSVTITQTNVIERDGQPSTHTVVLTKTQTSTLIDTITKIQTLLQPTSVLSTITTTVPVTVSKETYLTALPTDSHPASTTVPTEHIPEDNDSIFVMMTDKKSGTAHIVPAPSETRPTGFEVQVPDEANEISPNDILYSGIYTQHSDNECQPECKVTMNEMCQKVENQMRCLCRSGFARMFPDHPCKPTYTYVMRVPLERQGVDEIRYTDSLADRTSPSHQQLTEAARDGLDRMVMQSNLRDIYHGIVVSGFEPAKKSDRAAVVYIVQLSENAEETKLQDEVHKTLKANNYSLGGTDVYAAPDMFRFIQAEDFDECTDNKYHDCSEHAQCFNLRGTYTCSCKEGFIDMSYSIQFPGRICSADAIGCELCNYHGTCYYKVDEEPTCECFHWYAGEFCQINLKVTLITLIAAGVLLSILLVLCLLMTCNKQKPPEILRTAPKPHVGFRRYRSITNLPGDKRAIVSIDTSSEGSIERTPPPFVKQRVPRNEPPNPSSGHAVGGHIPSSDRDRSLTVLIPRAKFRPISSQPSSTLLTMSTFEPEQKLLNYAASRESCRTSEKKISRCSMPSRRLSNSTNLSIEPSPRKKNSNLTRPSSGALVSAGFEVSATVRRTRELEEAYVSQSHNDLNQPTYNSIRTAESSLIMDVPALPVFESSVEDFMTRVDRLGTVSEARSYDETTIQPPMRSLHNLFHARGHTYDSKHSSSQKDENHTMGERDLGSTYMPKSQLYKPDHRESEGSNFDSL